MAVTSGFFDSVNGDRKYNAEQMSAIFNGIINDGVFQSIGDAFAVKANGGYTVNVGTGRAWFKSTWVNNDSVLPITLDEPNSLLNRYDAIIIEVNRNSDVRSATIKVLKGTEASSPKWPNVIRNNGVYQYPIAYIYRKAGSTSVTQSNIQYWPGNGAVPFVTAILETTNTDNMLAQWKAQWEEWYNATTYNGENNWNNWYNSTTTEGSADFEAWMTSMKTEFDTWFDSIKTVIDDDVAASLASSVQVLEENTKVFSATFTANGWSGNNSQGWTQTANCAGMLPTYNVEAPIALSTGVKATDIARQEALDILCEAGNYGETQTGKIKWTCYDAKPTADLPVLFRRINVTS